MARYIDADRLKRTFASGIRVYDGMCKIDDVMHNIENEPTADVVEVCRCKECKNSRKQDKVFGITDYKCMKHNISCLSPYDFCSYGKRRDT